MASKKYDGGGLIALTAGEQTTVDNDYVGHADFDEAVTAGLTTVIDFANNRWVSVAVGDEGANPDFESLLINDEKVGGGGI